VTGENACLKGESKREHPDGGKRKTGVCSNEKMVLLTWGGKKGHVASEGTDLNKLLVKEGRLMEIALEEVC